MIPCEVIRVTFIIKRHSDNKKDLISRFKSLNIVERRLNKFALPLDTKTKRQIPLSESTFGVIIDEQDLTTFKIDATLKIENNNQQKIDGEITYVLEELKKLNKPRLVLIWIEKRRNGTIIDL